MYFLDYYGPAELYGQLRGDLERELAATFGAPPESAQARRLLLEQPRAEVELWVELGSEEQLVRHGRDLAQRLSAVVRAATLLDVWVMFRIVPLSHAFLNGVPRARAHAWPD